MAILSIKADIKDGATAYLGGAQALNLLGREVAGSKPPSGWKGMLDGFLELGDGGTFKLGGHTIEKNGLYVNVKGQEYKNANHPGPAYWEIADGVGQEAPTKLASTVRKLLGDPGHAVENPWVATLVAAMFLSEVVRNPRSLAVNLMLLDLIESGTRYGRDAGPESGKVLDFRKLLVFGGGGKKSKTYTYEGGDVKVDKVSGTLRGGKLPMSQLDAMAQFQKSTAKTYENKMNKGFNAVLSQAALNLKAPADGGYHFATPLLEKECTVALRWLLAYCGRNSFKGVGGHVKSTEMVPSNAWFKDSPKVEKIVLTPWYGDVRLSGLREQLCQTEWQNCAAPQPGALARQLADKAAGAFAQRAGSLALMLA